MKKISLNPGDCIYGVYKSAIYECPVDGGWFINDCGTIFENHLYHVEKDVNGEQFECISVVEKASSPLIPKLINYHVNFIQAKYEVKQVYLRAFQEMPCHITSVFPEDGINEPPKAQEFDIKTWAYTNKICILYQPSEIKRGRLVHNHIEYMRKKWGYDCGYNFEILSYLREQGHFAFLHEIWEHLGYKPLAFVQEYVVNRTCYLIASNKYLNSITDPYLYL